MVVMGRNERSDFTEQLVALLPRMRRFAYALSGNQDEGDDLVQAACERALRKRGQFQPGTRFESWVLRIIYSQRVDLSRSSRVRTPHFPWEERDSPETGEEELEAKLLLRQVLQTVAGMAEKDRAVLALVCIEGLSYKESAAILELPVGTVMSRLARARQRLYQRVHGDGAGKTPGRAENEHDF